MMSYNGLAWHTPTWLSVTILFYHEHVFRVRALNLADTKLISCTKKTGSGSYGHFFQLTSTKLQVNYQSPTLNNRHILRQWFSTVSSILAQVVNGEITVIVYAV